MCVVAARLVGVDELPDDPHMTQMRHSHDLKVTTV